MPSYIILNCKYEIYLSFSSKVSKFNDDWYIECLCNTTTSIDLRNRTIDNQAPSYQAAASLSYDADKYNNNNSIAHPACTVNHENIEIMIYEKQVISSKRNSVINSLAKIGRAVKLVPLDANQINLCGFYSYPLSTRDYNIYHDISEEEL
ncbi:unnamed protein product [Adineta steineri]|uniref:Uncharacterized protein n=1 Tax=Adineta steineri TaxID=433720 RepID=A0A819C0P5_9BILA|nr:unnamed protein product [Adineta steineri]